MLNIYHLPEKRLPYKHVVLKRRYTLPEERAEPQEHDGKMSESLSRTRRLVMDYAYCNRFDLFCTFTFDKDKIDRKDYALVKKKLLTFFKNHRQRYDPEFRYMIIPEFHKDGAVHFHGLITMPVGACTPLKVPKRVKKHDGEVLEFVTNTKHYLAWPAFSERFGFFSAGYIKDYDRCVSYIQKYITKDLLNSGFAKGSRLLLKSNDLKRPELVYQGEGGMLYRPDFENEFCAVSWMSEHDTAPLYSTWQYDVTYRYKPEDWKLTWWYGDYIPPVEQLQMQDIV